MKSYKQILEAINRGIQLALDDFDDEDQVQNNIKSNKSRIETTLKNIWI